MPPLLIPFSYGLDLAFGDPPRLPHPVRLIGLLIAILERLLLPLVRKSRLASLAAGAFTCAVVVGLSYTVSFFIVSYSYRHLGWAGGSAVSVLLGYACLSARGLSDAAAGVLAEMERGDFPAARKKLAMVVGRDTETLDEPEIGRAVVETVAENTSDGVVAPLFYLAIGGAPLVIAYKAVNTLDSMIGYKSEKYLYFGKAAARLDDIANLIPARLTGLLMAASSWLLSLKGLKYSWKGAFKILARDSGNHPSPNSGWPEAAAAGALMIRLGGENSYFGVKSVKPYIGDPVHDITAGKVRDMVRLMFATSLLALVVSVTIGLLIYIVIPESTHALRGYPAGIQTY